MAAYTWKRGCFLRGDAQAAGEVCRGLEERGELTPRALVEASRAHDAPLHRMFEWDDEAAAEKYRESQAQHIISSIEVVPTGRTEPVRAFVSLAVGRTERHYSSTEVALSEPDSREMVLRAALSELRAFERKYRQLAELADVLAAIREVA